MNKVVRILLILVVLAGVVAIVGSKTAWASPAPAAPAEKVNPASAAIIPSCTTCPPAPSESEQEGIDVSWGKQDGPVSINGLATLLASGSDSNAFVSLGPRVDGFLSKVVQLSVVSGTFQLCFSAPDGDEKIYVFSDDKWVPLPFTFFVDNQACVDVSASGNYILGK